jgi:threonine dehydratase
VALVDEALFLRAVRWLLAEHQLLVEPSGAAVLAAILEEQLPVPEARRW